MPAYLLGVNVMSSQLTCWCLDTVIMSEAFKFPAPNLLADIEATRKLMIAGNCEHSIACEAGQS